MRWRNLTAIVLLLGLVFGSAGILWQTWWRHTSGTEQPNGSSGSGTTILLATPGAAAPHRADGGSATSPETSVAAAHPRTAQIPVMPLISQGVPVSAERAIWPAMGANNKNYTNQARIAVPGSVTYDLSSVPAAQRQRVLVAWYNDATGNYDSAVINEPYFNVPRDYTIEANTAPGGRLPATGWTTLVTVTDNPYHSRQHVVDLAGANWIRMRVTAVNGSPGNMDAAFHLDIHDASAGTDSWIIYGDSITSQVAAHRPGPTFGQMVAAALPGRTPSEEAGGMGYFLTEHGAENLDRWLTDFPGRFVGIAYGTNDAWNGIPAGTYAANLAKMVEITIAHGKTPIIASIPWSRVPAIQQHAPAMNAEIAQVVATHPGAMIGPDLWTAVKNNPGILSQDGVLPTDAGATALRQVWANWAVANLYTGHPPAPPVVDATPPSTPTRFAATAIDSGTVDLAWAKSTDNVGVTGYILSRDGGTVAALTGTTYRDYGLVGNTAYHYTVVARDAAGNRSPVAAVAVTTLPPPSVPPPTSNRGLHVAGNQLEGASGKPVILRGVDYAGLEYACIQGWGIFDGPSDEASVQAMANWGINAVNLGLNEDCWLGINGAPPAYSGTVYQKAIHDYVALLERHHITPILSLYWEAPGTQPARGQLPMPDADHAPAMWHSVANAYKGDTDVILRLKEEPFPDGDLDSTAAWKCWRDGGPACNASYVVAGMQTLLNTVRATGATNVVQVPGIQYANSMTHFLAFAPSDPLGQLMAVADVYPATNICGTVACYAANFAPVIAKMPFLVGEFGESANATVCGVAGSNALMDWLDAHHSGYLAWTWNTWGTTCADLSLITNFGGTPKSPNGTNYQRHLKAVLGLP